MTVTEDCSTVSPIDVHVLGPLLVHGNGKHITLTPTQGLVLLLLLSTHGHPVPKETLQRLVYDRDPDRRTDQTIRRHVKDLRDTLAAGIPPTRGISIIVTTRVGVLLAYWVDPALVGVDAHRFERYVAGGNAALQAGRWADAAHQFHVADSMWRDDPLPDVVDRSFSTGWVTRLMSWRRIAISGYAESLIRLGRHRQVIPALHAHVVTFPGDSWLWRQLVIAQYVDGRDGDAAQTLRDAIAAFRGEGLDPGCFYQLQRDVLTLSLPRTGGAALDFGDHLSRPPRSATAAS